MEKTVRWIKVLSGCAIFALITMLLMSPIVAIVTFQQKQTIETFMNIVRGGIGIGWIMLLLYTCLVYALLRKTKDDPEIQAELKSALSFAFTSWIFLIAAGLLYCAIPVIIETLKAGLLKVN